ncbi:hypothetical protein ABMA27_006983 [Loxostege sticticalis]|uniref:Uncharacterized protein n=1 Tax=Loxostege sticticalis TaxID=481309 RepID=A0ABR3IL45_LOXSC
MRGYIVFCVVCLQLGWTYGVPAGKGVGAFAYQDSAGNSRFNDFGFNFMMPFEMPNSAYAGAAVGPGFSHQVAALNPENPREPNVNVMNRFSDNTGPGGKFYSVSSSSYSSSSNVNGRQETKKGAETLVNNNGVVTHYKVQN